MGTSDLQQKERLCAPCAMMWCLVLPEVHHSTFTLLKGLNCSTQEMGHGSQPL